MLRVYQVNDLTSAYQVITVWLVSVSISEKAKTVTKLSLSLVKWDFNISDSTLKPVLFFLILNKRHYAQMNQIQIQQVITEIYRDKKM